MSEVSHWFDQCNYYRFERFRSPAHLLLGAIQDSRRGQGLGWSGAGRAVWWDYDLSSES